MFVASLDGEVREQIRHGYRRVLLDGSGKPTFEVDPLIAAHALEMPDEEWEIFYGNRKRTDIYKRDENGALIPCTVFDPPPAALKIHGMRSLLPNPLESYGTQRGESERERRCARARCQCAPCYAIGSRRLQSRLNAIRAKGPQNPKPDAAVPVGGRDSDKPDDGPKALPPPRALADHPRAHHAPAPEPAETAPARPPYARPDRDMARNGERTGAGRVDVGGYKTA